MPAYLEFSVVKSNAGSKMSVLPWRSNTWEHGVNIENWVVLAIDGEPSSLETLLVIVVRPLTIRFNLFPHMRNVLSVVLTAMNGGL